MSLAQALELAGYGAVGALLGVAYFLMLRRAVDVLARDGATLQAVPLFLARAGAAVLAFWVAAQAGPWPLLATAGGFLAARAAVLMLTARRR